MNTNLIIKSLILIKGHKNLKKLEAIIPGLSSLTQPVPIPKAALDNKSYNNKNTSNSDINKHHTTTGSEKRRNPQKYSKVQDKLQDGSLKIKSQNTQYTDSVMTP